MCFQIFFFLIPFYNTLYIPEINIFPIFLSTSYYYYTINILLSCIPSDNNVLCGLEIGVMMILCLSICGSKFRLTD